MKNYYTSVEWTDTVDSSDSGGAVGEIRLGVEVEECGLLAEFRRKGSDSLDSSIEFTSAWKDVEEKSLITT